MSRRHQRDHVSVWAVIAIVTMVLVTVSSIIGIGWFYLNEGEYDKVTGCRLEQNQKIAPSQLVVLMDVTDKLDEDVAERVRGYLQEAIQEQPEGALIELYALDERISNYDRSFLHCVPRKPNEANKFTDNIDLVTQEFERTFKGKLDVTIQRLTSMNSPRDRSPLCEMIKAVTIKSFATKNDIKITGSRRLIIVSDFMQHFPGKFSMYDKKNPDRYNYKKFAHSSYGSALILDSSNENMRGLNVDLWYTNTMTSGNVRFWEDYFYEVHALVNHATRK